MIATAPYLSSTWEICRVYVHPNRHGTGLGRDLLDIAERHAIAAGADRFVLWTDTRFARAHAFYAKHGYLRQPDIRTLDKNVLEYCYRKM